MRILMYYTVDIKYHVQNAANILGTMKIPLTNNSASLQNVSNEIMYRCILPFNRDLKRIMVIDFDELGANAW